MEFAQSRTAAFSTKLKDLHGVITEQRGAIAQIIEYSGANFTLNRTDADDLNLTLAVDSDWQTGLDRAVCNGFGYADSAAS